MVNAGKTESHLKVKASFKSGCFGIDFVSAGEIAARFKDLFTSDAISAILNAGGVFTLLFGSTGSLFWLLKKLKGRKPTKISHNDGSCIFIIDKEKYEVESKVYELYREFKIRAALEQVVNPLEQDGIDSFAVIQNEKVLVETKRSELVYFSSSVLEVEELSDDVRETWLNIVSPAFKDGDKWRVNDGGANYYVSLEDPDFLLKVLKNEVEFGASTRLKVRLRELQFTDSKGVLRKECVIEKVINVHKPDEQMDFSG